VAYILKKFFISLILICLIFTNFVHAEAKTVKNNIKLKKAVSSNVNNIHPDKAYKLGMDAFNQKDYSKALYYFDIAIKGNPSAANYIMLAKSYEALGKMEDAANFYTKASEIYEKKGLKDDAEIYKTKAKKLTTEVRLYQFFNNDNFKESYSGAKYEPVVGAYIGAYIDADPNLKNKGKSIFEEFNSLFGNHSVFFTYHYYGQPFPKNWVNEVRKTGAIPQLAIEPENLDEVKDDEYLREFAKEAAKYGGPLFIRFASEMNGNWTPYHNDPEKYKEKFRLVHDVFERIAPNVAMVWTPNAVPEKNIDEYYPGDEYVDWVGVNFYAVAYHNMNINEPAFDEDPTIYLDYVYNKYSHKKPIQISEWAATHKTTISEEDLSNFAVDRIKKLYYYLPRKYPRIKMVCWFDSNNITNPFVPAERRINNYSLTENYVVGEAYKKAIESDYFIKSGQTATGYFKSVPESFVLKEDLNLSAYIKTYDEKFTVKFLVDDIMISYQKDIPYQITLSPKDYKDGWHTLEIRVIDSKNRLAKSKKYKFIVEKSL